MNKPYCIVITGRPGSGKTTLAKEIGRSLHLPVISRDEVKEGYVHTFGVSHEELPIESNGIATRVFFDIVDNLLKSKISIVLEAAFQHRVWSSVIPDWGQKSRLSIILCEPPADLCGRRHLERGLNEPAREKFHGDHRVKTFRETGEYLAPGDYKPPKFDCQTLTVNTEKGYEPTLGVLIKKLNLKLAQPVAGTDPAR